MVIEREATDWEELNRIVELSAARGTAVLKDRETAGSSQHVKGAAGVDEPHRGTPHRPRTAPAERRWRQATTSCLTVTAADSSNTAASASVTITVKTANEPPIAADDTAHAAPDRTVLVDVAANDTDPEGDINPASLAVAVPAAAGRTSARSGPRRLLPWRSPSRRQPRASRPTR